MEALIQASAALMSGPLLRTTFGDTNTSSTSVHSVNGTKTAFSYNDGRGEELGGQVDENVIFTTSTCGGNRLRLYGAA
jgi:hypothetical protein